MSFYNTTGESGGTLKDMCIKAGAQTKLVLECMMRMGSASPSAVARSIGRYPLTSIRRAMTDLTSDGFLERTNEKTTGPYGRPEYIWRYVG